MKQDRRGSWYLLTGIVLGATVGLVYSWMISPVKYINAPPYALRADYKDEYRALVAAAFLYSGDLLRAEGRLAQLRDDDPARSLAMQAQSALAAGRPEAEVRALGILAVALTKGVTPYIPGTPTQALPAGSFPPPATSSAQGETFVLEESAQVCDPDQPGGMLQIVLEDADGQPVPGVEVVITWEGGEEHIFTGEQPELGLGYAGFTMTAGISYSVQLGGDTPPVNDLTAGECSLEDGSSYPGSWRLLFIRL